MQKIILLMLFTCGMASAQIPADVIKEIDQRIEHGINPSIVVGVYDQGVMHFYTKGLQNKALNLHASENSVYEIGSISKTFTALLLAQKVQAKALTLDDAVQDFWPQPFKLEDNNHQAITFKQLSTHTSGLPRIPSNLSSFSNDPYADYDRETLLEGINKAKPVNAGETYAYSNFATGLLGETMAVIDQRPFNELVKTNILEPLDLKQTYMLLEEVPEAILAQGYMGNKPSNAWQFKALAGAGSIRSSIHDLVKYGVAHLNQPAGAMREAMDLATSSHYEQGRLRVGLGWHFNPNGVLWHNGGTGGFRSMLMIDPKQQKVVAAMTNHNTNVDDIVIHMMDPNQAMKQHDFPVSIDVDQLTLYTGRFKQSETDKTIAIERRNDRLFFIAPKQPKYAMTYIGDDTFKLNLAKVKIQFKLNEQSHIESLELRGWGQPQVYEKTIED